jgi:hypothetical protein
MDPNILLKSGRPAIQLPCRPRAMPDALPNLAVLKIKAAPLRSAAPGRARVGLRPWEADPPRRAGHQRTIR